MKYFLLIAGLLFITLQVNAQCVIINEVMINPTGACDGSCNPNTSEWIELYNTCNTPIDLSCYVLTDGDYTVTFPTGTNIAAYGYLVIGSPASGGPVDIDIASCGCTAGTNIGTLTNPNEQLILLNSTGVQQDAIYWGSGQFPVNITSITLGACAPVTVSNPNNNGYASIPLSSTSGCSIGRTCDASTTWQVKCGSNVSMGTSNGLQGIPDFTASSTTICPGDCISFTDNSQGNPLTWFWTFSGAATGTSNLQNPTSICYNNTGNFTVTLQITNSCGTFTHTETGYIQVGAGASPTISANGPISFCDGNNVVLSTVTPGTYQWLLNGIPIPGETGASITVTQSGDYSLSVGSASCTGFSNVIQVNVIPSPTAQINALSSTTLCTGQTLTIESQGAASTYQWLLNGVAIPGETQAQITINDSGNYSLQLNNNGCPAISNIITVSLINAPVPIISSSSGVLSFCVGTSITLETNSGFTNYQWFLNNNAIPGATSTSLTTTQEGSYTISATSAGGCITTSVPVVVTMLPLPEAQLNPSGSVIICNGMPVLIQVQSTASIFQWYLNSNPIPGATSASYSAASSGQYYVELTSNQGCVNTSAPVTVSFNTGITVDINASKTIACQGDVIYLSTAQNYNNIEWSNGDSGIQIGVTQGGPYSVIVTSNGGCIARDTISLTFLPKPFVDAGDHVVSDCVNPIELNGTGEGIPLWSPSAGLNDTTNFTIKALPEQTTIYYLTVNNGTCSAKDSVIVTAECSAIYIPTAFTPNNDGLNDVFKAVGRDVEQFTLWVFNRWGEKIFETTNLNIGWDGYYKGVPAPVGLYIWQAEAFDINGKSLIPYELRKGVVSLVR